MGCKGALRHARHRQQTVGRARFRIADCGMANGEQPRSAKCREPRPGGRRGEATIPGMHLCPWRRRDRPVSPAQSSDACGKTSPSRSGPARRAVVHASAHPWTESPSTFPPVPEEARPFQANRIPPIRGPWHRSWDTPIMRDVAHLRNLFVILRFETLRSTSGALPMIPTSYRPDRPGAGLGIKWSW